MIIEDNLPISKILCELEKKFPEVHFHLEGGQAIQLEQRVANGELQFAFGYFQELSPNLTSDYLFTERHLCYCGTEHEFFHLSDDDISVEQIQNSRIAGYDDFDESEKRLAPLLSNYDSCAGSSEGILALILTGKYIGVMTESFGEIWSEKGKIRNLNKEGLELFVEMNMIYQTDKIDEPAIKAIIAITRKLYPVVRKKIE
jgi:DNA-binding transcriptional LysR family regulator